jgi:integrase/recombinase XerD
MDSEHSDKGDAGQRNTGGTISGHNYQQLTRFIDTLRLKAYSANTIRTYRNEFIRLLKTIGRYAVDDLTVDHLRRYLIYCMDKEGLQENSVHSRINALKFYYEQVLGRDRFFIAIPRPKKAIQLPRFFNQAEVLAIIKSVANLKHKVMLMLAYGAGLRVSEVVKVRVGDIDSERMSIRVEGAKGKKDRLVMLSPALLVMLREYWRQYKPFRGGYLFEGQLKGMPYSTRSLQLVLQAAKQKAGIMRPGGMHALRHSFATHLLDKGTDILMIMKLLGHNDLKTTLRYLHVTNKDMLRIISPLDDLNLLG